MYFFPLEESRHQIGTDHNDSTKPHPFSFSYLLRTPLIWNPWKNQTINIDKTEFVHAGSIGFVLNDYPTSGANNRHSSYPGGSRWKEQQVTQSHSLMWTVVFSYLSGITIIWEPDRWFDESYSCYCVGMIKKTSCVFHNLNKSSSLKYK